MENRQLKTKYIKHEIARCEDIQEVKEVIFPMLESQQSQWMRKIQKIIEDSGYTKTRFAQLCGVSRMAVNKWCNGAIPKNREMFLRIGMIAGYNREKMDQLLQRYGRYPALYAKSLEDCICIFVLEQSYGEDTLATYDYVLNKIKDNIMGAKSEMAEDIDTLEFDEKLSELKDVDELEVFILKNTDIFATAYHRFYAYVKMHIMANYQEFGGTVHELAIGQEWSSSLRQCVSAIRQNKWFPTRNKIISLGIHLSMDHQQIDEMLELAHMEGLCAKNLFESVIMFILDDASLNNMLDAEAEGYDPDALCRYARMVLEQLDFPEIDSFITELPGTDDDEW